MPPLIAPLDDSGDDNDDPVTEENHFAEPFIAHPILDGESDDDENEVRIGEIGVQPLPRIPIAEIGISGVFRPIEIERLGDPSLSISYPFEIGNEEDTLEGYRNMFAFDIVLKLAEPFFEVLRNCSNSNSDTNISMKHLYLYHAFLTLRVLMNLDTTEIYYNSPPVFKWADYITELFSIFLIKTFYYIWRSLKGYMPDDNTRTKTRSWKVDNVVEAVRSAFVKVHRRPGEFLSFDEGMAQGSAMRNPIYTSLGKAKPLEGYRFFLLVDYTSKVVLNFMLDTKIFTAENCIGQPGGFVGAIVDYVISGAQLKGKYYKVMQDNYYQSVSLAVHIRDNRNILCAGTAQKRHIDKQKFFRDAKRPLPSNRFPKGSLKMSFNETVKVYEYSYMDSAGAYFIDPIYGPGERSEIYRKNSTGERIAFKVPKLISMYNKCMHGVDVFDQIRKLFGVDLAHPTKKFTVRVFEILYSMILGQAYNIYRHFYANTNRALSHMDFKIAVITGFLNSHVVRAPNPGALPIHNLCQFPLGSCDDGTQKRKRLMCRECPNTDESGQRNN